MLKTIFLSACFLVTLSEVVSAPKGSPCPALKLKFGRVRYRQKGRFVKFMCNTGYIIAGEKYSTCHNGAWDSLMPRCVRASCTKVNPPVNGLIYPSHRGAVLNFFCKPGFDLRGPNATYCDGFNWDNKLPACIESNSKPALSCDFETEDLCGWNQDLRHDFDWTRMSFRTPSGHLGTGPSFDHTKGEEETGYYMYIESSSRNENDTARLISPIYDKINDTDVCFEFFYHMHGASTGQLRVYLKRESESWALDPGKALFWRSGNHGDVWLRSLNYIGPVDEDFQIIIEGVRGTSYFSDIAIDDVRLIPNCTIEEDATTESDVTYTDDFDNMGSCLNRCDNDNLIVPPSSFQYNCDCDETCIDNNTCCIDYIALCVLGPTEDGTFTSEASTTTENETTTIFVEASATKTTTMPTSMTTTAAVTPKLQTIKEKLKKLPNITSNDINSVLPKPKINSTDLLPSKPLRPIQPKRPTLVFLTPSTPEVIIQKLLPIKPSTRSTSLTTKPPIDEVITISKKSEDDEALYVTPPAPLVTEKVINSNPAPVRKISKDVELFANSNVETQKIVDDHHDSSSGHIITIIFVSVGLILSAILAAVIMVRCYKRSSSRNMYGTSSDSQSDVRFLTSDEVLDFNLAYPDDD